MRVMLLIVNICDGVRVFTSEASRWVICRWWFKADDRRVFICGSSSCTVVGSSHCPNDKVAVPFTWTTGVPL